VASEIPSGILTAIIGAPFFAFVFWKTQHAKE
jgi:ABC-type Fe3+-siderophore transport system permease subunit